MVAVSIIIPVHNVENYLVECLDSVINQTYTDFEVICIENGSTDKSFDVLQSYAAKDNRIKVLRSEITGISIARNKGLDEASGKYICFVDSDDTMPDNALQLMVDAIEYNDVDFVCGYASVLVETDRGSEKLKSIQRFFDKQLKENGEHQLELFPTPHTTPWGQLLKKNIIDKYSIRFPEGLVHEDEYFRVAYQIHCNKFYYIAQNLYNYRVRNGSVTDDLKNINHLDIIDIDCLIVNELKKFDLFDKYKNDLQHEIKFHIASKTCELRLENYQLYQKKVAKYLELSGFDDDFYQSIKEDIEYDIPFSIIIPVYNVAPYLEQCLDSLLQQTCGLFELICVDDGSIDNSLDILRKYEKQYKQIKVISSPNRGVSSARNLGIEAAKGKYLMFIDSDDFVEPDMLKKIYPRLQENGLDWIMFGAHELNDFTSTLKNSPYYVLSGIKPHYSVYQGQHGLQKVMKLPHETWNKAFRHKIIEQNKICFRLSCGEDCVFGIEFMFCANRYAILKEQLYYYRHPRKGSIMDSGNVVDKHIDMLNALAQMEKNVSALNLKKCVAMKYIQAVQYLLSKTKYISKIRYDLLRSTLKNNKAILLKYKDINKLTVKNARFVVKHGYWLYIGKQLLKTLNLFNKKAAH